MSWDLFGEMFDLNGDGETDMIEQAIGFSILDEMSRDGEDEEEDD